MSLQDDIPPSLTESLMLAVKEVETKMHGEELMTWVEGENARDGAKMGHTKENLIVAQMGELITEGLEFSSLHYDNKEVDSEEVASEIVEDFEEDLKQMFGTEVAVVEEREAEEKTPEDELQLQAQE